MIKSAAVAFVFFCLQVVRLATLKGLLNSSLAEVCVCLFSVHVFFTGSLLEVGHKNSMCIPKLYHCICLV